MHEQKLSLSEARRELSTRAQIPFINNSLRYKSWTDVFMSQTHNLQRINDQVEQKEFLYAGLITYTQKDGLLDYFPTTDPRDFVIDQLRIGVRTISRHWEEQPTSPSLDFRVARVIDPERIRQTKEFLAGFHKAVTNKPLPANYW